jgi:hypothetical protein
LVSTTWVRFFFWLYLLFLVWAEATVTNPADPDLWHRLTLGEYLWQNGHFPAGDQFSYLSDYKYVADHEWGSALIFFWLYRAGGPSAMVALKLITLTVTLALLVWAGLQHRRPTLLNAFFYALVLLALLPSFGSTVRCMVFTHIFFALWLYWFQRERHGWVVPTFLYPLTMVVWANLHGGFAIGLAWLLMVGGVELMYGGEWRKWMIRLGLSTAVTLINPFGWRLWYSTARALVTTREGFKEWAPVSWWSHPLDYPGYKLMLLGVIAGLAIALYRRGWKQMDQPVMILLGFFMVLSLTSARHTSLFGLVAGALVPGLFPSEPEVEEMDDPLQRLGSMAFYSALVLIPLYSAMIVLPGMGLQLEYPSIDCPVKAVAYLQRENIQGKLLVPFNYGSYAMWELRGRMRVSMDGRYDLVYSAETYRRVDDFYFGRGNWKSLLSDPKPDAILVPQDDDVYRKLLAQPDWREAWRDSVDAVFLPR